MGGSENERRITMRVFVAGATGVIGRRLVPRLIEAGHTVTVMTRNLSRAKGLAFLGAEPVACDVYDVKGLEAALGKAKPDVVVHQLTALPKAIDPRKLEEQLAANDRIRVEGTRNLVRAAALAGARRMVAQSIAFVYTPEGGPVKDEDAPLWLDAPWPWRRSVEAVAELERRVMSAGGVEGVVLRYGYFYGPGTAYAADGSVADLVRTRQFPIAGRGSGVFSFVHVDDAASATVSALEHGQPGIYNIVDDEPSPVRDWLPVYAKALGAPAPRKVPAFLARLMAGRYGLYYMTEQRGASNERAKWELGWSPAFPTWRTGFQEALGNPREEAYTSLAAPRSA
jgi:nucleoside-diphosphate-sugar epimerase